MEGRKKSATDRSWRGGTTVTFAKAHWKDPCTGLWKGPACPCFNMGLIECLDFFAGRKWSLMTPKCLVQCVEQRGASLDDLVTAGPHPEELEIPTSLTLRCHHSAVWERKKTIVMVGDSQFLGDAAAQTSQNIVSYYSGSRQGKMTGRVSTMHLGTQTSTLPM